MFLVLGTKECPNCSEAILFLDLHQQRYKYVDLTSLYEGDWRYVFRILSGIIGTHRTIPLIFVSDNESTIPNESSIENLAPEWRFIGGCRQMQDYIYEHDENLANNY